MYIAKFFQEANGQPSSTRLAFLLWVVGILAIWSKVCWTSGALVPIDGTVLTLLGILMSGKVVQKFGEQSTQEVGSDSEKGQ